MIRERHIREQAEEVELARAAALLRRGEGWPPSTTERYLAKLAVEEEDFIEIARRFGRPLGPVRSER